MKQSLDFTEIKEFCDKVGLNCQIIDEGVIITKPKDIWDGVEFASNGLKIHKIKKIDRVCVYWNTGGFNYIADCKPSTESAYVEQLKKEAFERFGEIKDGDLFDRSALLDFKDTKSIGDCYGFEGFRYYKENDGLDFNGTCIYKQGNWATRVKERVKVDHVGVDYSTWSGNVFFGFSFKESHDIDKSGIGKFLAQQLEKYLNGEIE